MPVIAFSTDANVASHGVYLLSFLPESDVDRIVQYASSVGKRSYAALIPDNPYGTVVEAAFKQDIARRTGSQIVALERYPHDKAAMAAPIKQHGARRDACRVPVHSRQRRCRAGRRPGASPPTASTSSGCSFSAPGYGTIRGFSRRRRSHGGWYAAPDGTGYRNFATRYRQRFNQDPVRTATLAYDAVALVAALVKTQGPQAFTPQVLTNPSGFSGIDGLFRFQPDGTNERGLAVLRVADLGAADYFPGAAQFQRLGVG